MTQTMKPMQFDLLLSNGEQIRVTLTIRDSLAYESAARGKGWGGLQDNIMRWQAVRAWSAATREHPGILTGIGWQQFVEVTDPEKLHLLEMQQVKDEDADDVEAGELGESGSADLTTG